MWIIKPDWENEIFSIGYYIGAEFYEYMFHSSRVLAEMHVSFLNGNGSISDTFIERLYTRGEITEMEKECDDLEEKDKKHRM